MTTSNQATLDQDYWNQRWQNNQTGWDTGKASEAITHYMSAYANKDAALLIPGCGNAYEAEFLLANGFTNITLIDIAPKAVETLQNKFAEHPQVKVICADFFEHQGHYDLLIEQTFFCAIPISQRAKYAEKAASLLTEKGKIIGVLFNREFDLTHPPYGGSSEEYQEIFSTHFEIKKMETCYNSIPPRANSEVFIHFIKR